METEQVTPGEELQYELRKEAICGHPEITIPATPWKLVHRPGDEDVVIASVTNEEVCIGLITQISAYPLVNVVQYPFDYCTDRTPAERDAIARIVAAAPDMLNWLIRYQMAMTTKPVDFGQLTILNNEVAQLIARSTGKEATNG